MSQAWQNLVQSLREWIGPPLRTILSPVDNFFIGLPMWAAQAAAVALFVLAGIWVWTLSRDFVYLGAPDRAVGAILRIWSTMVLIPYVAVYLWLGR